MKKYQNSDRLSVIDNYNFYDRHAYKHCDSMTDPAQRPESMKISF